MVEADAGEHLRQPSGMVGLLKAARQPLDAAVRASCEVEPFDGYERERQVMLPFAVPTRDSIRGDQFIAVVGHPYGAVHAAHNGEQLVPLAIVGNPRKAAPDGDGPKLLR